MTSIFSPEALDKIVKETLPADAEPGELVVVGGVDQDGAKVVASFRKQIDQHSWEFSWEFQAAARHDWTGDNSIGGNVIFRWRPK